MTDDPSTERSGGSCVRIAPSLLAADFGRLAESVAAVEAAGAEVLHLDVMDGVFVPNISFGQPVIQALRRVTSMPMMAHLMVDRPERYIDDFRRVGCDEIQVHEEAGPHLHRTLQAIRASGARAGVALNVHTPLSVLEYVTGLMDSLLIMSVNPGFGGQVFLPEMLPKIRAARQMLGPDVDIVVDGGVDERTARSVVEAGANVLVAGTSVFGHPNGPAEGIRRLRSAIAG